MAEQAREVYFTGGLPIRPAAQVFEALGEHIGPLAPRYPDGDIAGWIWAATAAMEKHPALEYSHPAAYGSAAGVSPTGATSFYRLKEGRTVDDLTLGPFGYATTAAASYQDFRRVRDAGKIPAKTRLEVTLPAPGTLGQHLLLPAEERLAVARAALWRDIQEMLQSIPHEDLCIQLDFAGGDLAPQEYQRRPWAFDTPKQKFIPFTMDQVVDASAWIANQLPSDVEFGFHLCTLWKHDPRGGQDNEVMVEAANRLSEQITHPIAYIHFPLIPEHDKNSDYWPFKNLALHPETKAYLGLINYADGLEGAKRRIELAEQAGGLSDFGVAFWCGLGNFERRTAEEHPDPRFRRNVAKIDEVLDFHRKVAEL
jgi:hypothetical protein